MKTTSIATFFAIASSTSSIGSAYERKLSDERRLGMGKYYGDASSKFAKYVDIYNRCCVPEPSVLESPDTLCRCPVRTFNKWGFDIYSKWNNKCETKIKDKSDLVALAVANGFDELVQLVSEREEIVEVLKSDNDDNGWTVFAPTDDAFEALPASCSSLDFDDITTLLRYHVVPGTINSTQLIQNDIKTATTAQGETVSIDASEENGVTINGLAKVIAVDVLASNGVAHAIDKVLIPPGFC